MGRKSIDRIGETRIMNNGLRATIISYRNGRDMDLQFENGIMSHNTNYDAFKNGAIKCPLIIETINNYAKITNLNTKNPLIFLVDTEDLNIVKMGYWCKNQGYANNIRLGQLHRLIMKAPNNMQIDHINGDKLDNRKQNLRVCTLTENIRNVGKTIKNTSGYKGVSWDKGCKKWAAQISDNGKNIHIGKYHDKKDAARAYNKMAEKLRGEFAYLNNI